MSNLTLKQKIILGVVVGLMLSVIGVYGYISLNQDEELDISELVSNNQAENQSTNAIQENVEINSENLSEVSRTRKR